MNNLENQKTQNNKKNKITVKDIALIGLMVALIEGCKVALAYLPNIELTSFLLILFTLFFGWKIVLVVPVFILIEGCIYGFGTWWIMYLYAWPLLVLLAWIFRRQESVWFWSILSGAFGLSFGFLCSFPYVVTGTIGAGIQSGLYAGFTWWVAGIPYDIVHCISNFVIMLVLYKPMCGVMKEVRKIV